MSIREERHKTITVLVSFIDDKPRFLTVRDRRHKDWIFITGGCRKRENSNPLRCALRELEEETRGVILLKEGSYSHFSFVHNTRTPEEEEQDRIDDLDVIIVYNVYVIEYNVSRHIQTSIIEEFDRRRVQVEQRKKLKLHIRRSYDENDMLSFDTIDEFKTKQQWSVIKEFVVDNPEFYETLKSPKRPFNL